MILIGRNFSPFTRRVAISLAVLGSTVERRELTAWHNLDEVREISPAGRVPVLVLDDGETIPDSGAILDYLDGEAGVARALLPPHGAERRALLRIVSAGLGVMDKCAAAFYEANMRPEAKRHAPWLAHNMGQARAALDWLEAHYATTWTAGGRLTQADITALVAFDFARIVAGKLGESVTCPNLQRHLDRAEAEIPAFAETRPEG